MPLKKTLKKNFFYYLYFLKRGQHTTQAHMGKHQGWSVGQEAEGEKRSMAQSLCCVFLKDGRAGEKS